MDYLRIPESLFKFVADEFEFSYQFDQSEQFYDYYDRLNLIASK